MAKKIPNVSQWGQGKARERYQVGGASFVPPQAMTRPGMPMGPMRRPFQSGGSADSDDLISKMPEDLGPQNLPPLHPGSQYGSGESSVYFPGTSDDPYSKRWLTESGKMSIRRPGTRSRGGKVK